MIGDYLTCTYDMVRPICITADKFILENAIEIIHFITNPQQLLLFMLQMFGLNVAQMNRGL